VIKCKYPFLPPSPLPPHSKIRMLEIFMTIWLYTDGLWSSTIADLSFITWDALMPWFFGEDWKDVEVEKNYPTYHAWNQKLMQRPAVQKVFKDKEAAVAKH